MSGKEYILQKRKIFRKEFIETEEFKENFFASVTVVIWGIAIDGRDYGEYAVRMIENEILIVAN